MIMEDSRCQLAIAKLDRWGLSVLWKLSTPFLVEHFQIVGDDSSQDEDANQTDGFHIALIGT
jgi:hypothetical protein